MLMILYTEMLSNVTLNDLLQVTKPLNVNKTENIKKTESIAQYVRGVRGTHNKQQKTWT